MPGGVPSDHGHDQHGQLRWSDVHMAGEVVAIVSCRFPSRGSEGLGSVATSNNAKALVDRRCPQRPPGTLPPAIWRRILDPVPPDLVRRSVGSDRVEHGLQGQQDGHDRRRGGGRGRLTSPSTVSPSEDNSEDPYHRPAAWQRVEDERARAAKISIPTGRGPERDATARGVSSPRSGAW